MVRKPNLNWKQVRYGRLRNGCQFYHNWEILVFASLPQLKCARRATPCRNSDIEEAVEKHTRPKWWEDVVEAPIFIVQDEDVKGVSDKPIQPAVSDSKYIGVRLVSKHHVLFIDQEYYLYISKIFPNARFGIGGREVPGQLVYASSNNVVLDILGVIAPFDWTEENYQKLCYELERVQK